MSHPFGDLLSQHLHRKHGLSQSKLAEGILQPPTVITAMCKGKRLTGPQARERVVAIIGWLHKQGALETVGEANALLNAAGMAQLNASLPNEAILLESLLSTSERHTLRKPSPTSRRTPNNLPAPTTALIGREQDVVAALKLLRQNDVRAITFLGPPGVGKTRLALQVAVESHKDPSPGRRSSLDGLGQAFADGAWFVALAPLSDVNLVGSAIVQALDIPSRELNPLEQVKLHLRDKQALLVLDNFEQILNAAPLVAEILAAAPDVKVLVTSRAALHLNGEHTLEVQPLEAQAAVELFVRRAQAIKSGFALTDANRQTIPEICKRLDGLPLAIELAAVRIKLFEPGMLLLRLSSELPFLTGGSSDLPARQRTLRDTIDWSYHLLTQEEQTLFRRLGVFAGGCTLEAIERVADEGLSTAVVDLMQSLADKSLVKVESRDGGPRFSLLEMLREYAIERLEKSGEAAALRVRHAEYFAGYAESAEPALAIQETSAWIEPLERERNNLVAALAEARMIDDAVLQTRFVVAMSPLLVRLPDPERQIWLPKLFAQPEARTNPFTYAKALYSAFLLSSDNVAIDDAWQLLLLQNATSIFESLGEPVWQAASLARLGNLAWKHGLFALTEQYCAHSAQLFEGAGQKALAANALVWTAGAQRDQGKFAEAERLFKQCIAMFNELHDEIGKGNAVNGLGELEYYRGDYVAANAYYDAAQSAFSGTLWRELTQFGKGRVAYAQGRTLEALRLLETCVADARFWANAALLSLTLHHLAFVQHLVSDEAQALALLHEALALQHKRPKHRQVPESLERAAWIAADQHHHRRAARLFGAAASMRKLVGIVIPLGDMLLHEPRLQAVKAALDEATFNALWADGSAMSPEQAIEYALNGDLPEL